VKREQEESSVLRLKAAQDKRAALIKERNRLVCSLNARTEWAEHFSTQREFYEAAGFTKHHFFRTVSLETVDHRCTDSVDTLLEVCAELEELSGVHQELKAELVRLSDTGRWSQAELAWLLGCSQQNVSRLIKSV